MYYSIEHEVPGRLRVRLNGVVRQDDVDPLFRVLLDCPAVKDAKIYPRIGSIAVTYGTLEGDKTRERVLDYLSAVDCRQLDAVRSDYTYALATRTHDLVLDLACTVGGFVMRRLFLPAPLDMLYAIWQYRHFLRLALSSLSRGKLDVASLDAAAIGASFAQGDASTASETMFLLDMGGGSGGLYTRSVCKRAHLLAAERIRSGSARGTWARDQRACHRFGRGRPRGGTYRAAGAHRRNG